MKIARKQIRCETIKPSVSVSCRPDGFFYFAGMQCAFWTEHMDFSPRSSARGESDLDLDEEESHGWNDLHEMRFNRGWCRFVLNAYLCIHYPGLIVMGAIMRKDLHAPALFLISAVVWLGLAYVILR